MTLREVRRVQTSRWLVPALLLLTLSACGDPLARQESTSRDSSSPPIVTVSADDAGSIVELKLGQAVVVDDLGVPMDEVYIESDDTAIVFPIQPSESQGRVGLVAVGEGGTFVNVWESFPTGKAAVPMLGFRVLVTD